MAFSELPTRYHLNCCFPRFFSSAILRDFQATLFLKSKSLLISSRGLSWSLACGSIKGHKNGNGFLTAANVKNWQRSRRCPKSRENFQFYYIIKIFRIASNFENCRNVDAWKNVGPHCLKNCSDKIPIQCAFRFISLLVKSIRR